MAGNGARYGALWGHGELALVGRAEVECTLLLILEQILCNCCFVICYLGMQLQKPTSSSDICALTCHAQNEMYYIVYKKNK